MKLNFLILLSLFYAQLTVASETNMGNPGGLVENGDKTELADRYVKREHYKPGEVQGTRFEWSSELEANMIDIQVFLSRYLIFSKRFWDETVFSSPEKYRLVEELPCVDKLVLKTNRDVTNFGCTIGTYTYLDKNLFPTLDLRTQALGLFHERLHVFYPEPKSHYWIAPLVTAVEDGLRLRDLQLHGDREPITDQQIKALEEMISVAGSLGFEIPQGWKKTRGPADPEFLIWKNGGGLVIGGDLNAIVDNVFVSVGSNLLLPLYNRVYLVNEEKYVRTAVGKVLKTDVVFSSLKVDSAHPGLFDSEFPYWIENVKVRNSFVSTGRPAANRNTPFDSFMSLDSNFGKLRPFLLRDSTIENSNFSGLYATNSKISHSLGSNSALKDAEIDSSRISSSTIFNSIVSGVHEALANITYSSLNQSAVSGSDFLPLTNESIKGELGLHSETYSVSLSDSKVAHTTIKGGAYSFADFQWSQITNSILARVTGLHVHSTGTTLLANRGRLDRSWKFFLTPGLRLKNLTARFVNSDKRDFWHGGEVTLSPDSDGEFDFSEVPICVVADTPSIFSKKVFFKVRGAKKLRELCK